MRGPVVLLGQDDAVGDVRGPVIARRLEAEAVALVEGEVDEALRLPAADVDRLLVALGVVAGTRRPLVLVGHAVALVDLHDRLEVRVVVAPVGAHRRGAGVAGADAVHLLEVSVKHLGVVGADAGDRLLAGPGASRGRVRTPRWANMHVAVAVRIGHAALVAEHRREAAGDEVGVGVLLRQPPRVLAAGRRCRGRCCRSSRSPPRRWRSGTCPPASRRGRRPRRSPCGGGTRRAAAGTSCRRPRCGSRGCASPPPFPPCPRRRPSCRGRAAPASARPARRADRRNWHKFCSGSVSAW